jgi:hypothetical protein
MPWFFSHLLSCLLSADATPRQPVCHAKQGGSLQASLGFSGFVGFLGMDGFVENK